MTTRPDSRAIQVVLLDIEGTTTPIAFVHEVLFPFARTHLREFLRAHAGAPEVADAVRLLAVEHDHDLAGGGQPPAWSGSAASPALEPLATYVEWLMDRDRKSPGLKLLQGRIWEDGYQAGTLRGQVYPDVTPAIRRWRAAGRRVAIYSSGSELAQRRLFESTEHGDLTPLLAGFFDTAVGAKVSAASYTRIAERLGVAPGAIHFVSDVTTELTAAREAGAAVVLSLRPGNSPQPDAEGYRSIRSFDEIEFTTQLA
ncbi:MAG: acireductone synthase [Vicinamibacterales bacterium]